MAERHTFRSGGRGVFPGLMIVYAAGLAILSLLGLAGRWNARVDIVNQFAPIWLVLAVAGLVVVLVTRSWRRSRGALALILFAVVAQAVICAPEWTADSGEASGATGGPDFSVLTFNIWNEGTDRQAIIDRVIASHADVVTLQEALAVEQLSSGALRAVYPYQATCDDWWGCEILILSKRPILDHHYAAPEPTGSGGPLWAVWITTTASDGRPVRVLSTHFAWPVLPDFRRAQVERLVEIARGFGDGSLIVTADCNASGTSFTLRHQDADLPSLARRTRALFSWPAIIDGTDWPAPFPILAIDQVYASHDWRTIGVERLPRSGSDHYPILVTLARGQQGSRRVG